MWLVAVLVIHVSDVSFTLCTCVVPDSVSKHQPRGKVKELRSGPECGSHRWLPMSLKQAKACSVGESGLLPGLALTHHRHSALFVKLPG